jgi:1-acyl-sn-glycerol-3-phosphate acyltransferase
MVTAVRRLVTVPLYVALLLVLVSTLPLTIPVAACVDLARQTPWATVRSITFFAWYLGCEVIGVAASFILWVVGRLAWRVPDERYLDWHFGLQWWWARALLRGAAVIFQMRYEVEGDDDLGHGPILLFIRHASVGDTVIPAVFVSGRHGIRLRYVLKRELLWDPCLDIVGNRLPNYFVDRKSEDSAREVAAVRRLAEDVGPGEGVLLYPEGTRFTEAKRRRILDRIRNRGEPVLAERAQSLRNVLPPRLGGPLGLLEERPDADVVFCAHVGFDRATRFSTFMNGGLVGVTVRVAFWRVPAADVPAEREARIHWLMDEWDRVDAWIEARREGGGTSGALR